MTSCLYAGEVWHRRRRPRVHEFTYRINTFCLDLDEIERQGSPLRLLAVNRRGLFSFWDRDHADGRDGSTRAKILALVGAHGVEIVRPRILLLTGCRLFGYVFNPVAFYFCYERAGDEPGTDALRAVVAEVNNTFGERRLYVLRESVSGAAARQVRRYSARKTLHVSPFVSMDADYDFRIRPPEDEVSVTILEREGGAPVLDARIVGRRVPLSDAALLGVALRSPFLAVKVIAAIHWEALRLWLKRVPFHRHSAVPAGGTPDLQQKTVPTDSTPGAR
jgi:hypothetical protein